MSTPTQLKEHRLKELLLRWDDLRRQGYDEPAHALCADDTELADELVRRIEAVREIDSVLGLGDSGEFADPRDAFLRGSRAYHDLPDLWRASAEYRPQKLHSHGGLGQIVIAHQEELNRQVAVKRIRPDKFCDPARDRFLREAEITARLQHPGIVPIYGLGHDDDGPFYTMPFIQGKTLHEAIEFFHRDAASDSDADHRTLAFRGLLQHFVTVCNTMAYAHDEGIVHRDLKPSNIMLGPYGETLVVDWGLAKAVRRDDPLGDWDGEQGSPSPSPSSDELTATGMVLGTPRYMSPEQAKGEPTGPASDIFNLGLILYAILTGKSAFDRADGRAIDALTAVREAVVVPPRRRDPNLPRSLEAICLKALSARPQDRYSSSRILADDISRWLADEPVSAWTEPWTYRWRRWLKRHRTAVTATAAALVAILVLGGAGVYSHERQVRAEMRAAEDALARAEQIRADARAAWSERLDATAWVRAEALAADAANRDTDRLPASLRRRLESLAASAKADAEEARADAALLNKLAAVRAAKNDPLYNASSSYELAFEERGFAIADADPAVMAAMLEDRPRPVTVGIVSYLDDWALLLSAKNGDRKLAARLTALARHLDADAWRNSLRNAMALSDPAQRKCAVRRLAASCDAAAQPSLTIALLAAALRETGEPGEAVRLLEPARFRHPDVWIYQELGLSLRGARPPRREAALRAFTAATTLRPEMGFELAKELREAGHTLEAISVLEDVTRRQPEAVNFYWLGLWMSEVGRIPDCTEMFERAVAISQSRVSSGIDDFETRRMLGMCLTRVEKFPAAIAELRAALRLNPDSADAHNNLALALHLAQDVAGAAAEWREAARLEPNAAAPRVNLGIALYRLGRRDDAIVEVREAIRLKPDLAAGHDALGFMLSEAHDLPGAIAAFREAIRLKPDSPQAHSNLGGALGDSGDLAGGIAELREAIRLDPTYFLAYQNLGDLLLLTGDRAGAVSAFQAVIRHNPKGPDGVCRLAHALNDLGRFEEARVQMERGHELGKQLPQWQEPSAKWVRECRRDVELEGKLAKVLAGRAEPADTAERAELAWVAGRKGLTAVATRLYAQALGERTLLTDDLAFGKRYHAARYAVLAGNGNGRDHRQPSASQQAEFRALALGWLNRDLAAWVKRMKTGLTQDRFEIVKQLARWRHDADLASVRDPAELSKLPESERDAWRALWANIDAARGKAEQLAAGPPHHFDQELPASPFAP